MNRYATLTLVGLLALAGLAPAAPTDVATTCELTDTKPTINPSELEAINSEDSKFLAKIGAYLEFNEDAIPIGRGKKYLELKLKEVTFYNSTHQKNESKIYTFKMNCAGIILLTHPEDFVSMSVTVAKSAKFANYVTCEVDSDYAFPLGHNICAPQAFPCYLNNHRSKILATINFVVIEYEVSMDLDSHKNKEFARPSVEYC